MKFSDVQYSKDELIEGKIFLIDKPTEWTSFDVVKKLKFYFQHHYNIRKLKVGHAGTLDPLSTGLLIVTTGKMTKKIHEFQDLNKTYLGCMKLGETTASYDTETPVEATFTLKHLSNELIFHTAREFLGSYKQIPPIYSALKQGGKRLYQYARSGREITVDAREIIIEKFEIEKINLPLVNFKVRCSKGTYIRSLVFDFGGKIKSGAHLINLRRTHIGDFWVGDALTVQ
ncbi:MAG: tRNA pseudouridine(55) synthase TruB [Flavobacteriaceae bacterium]|nr:tRNA pseudouridine(55) synthase TruB [Flavobacteriaceae bacterium]